MKDLIKKEVGGVVKEFKAGVADMREAWRSGMKDLKEAAEPAIEVLPSVPLPLVHMDLCKQLNNNKVSNYYEFVSESPVDETHFYQSYLVKHKESGEYRSLRKILKKRIPKSDFAKEVEGFSKIYHPNIMHLYETLEDRKYYYFVLDRVDRPNIYQAIPQLFQNPQDFDETQVALIMRTLLRALEFCHKYGFPHTNLTPQNILVPPGPGLKGLYIVGFGQARMIQRNSIYAKECQAAGHLDQSNKDYDPESNEEDAPHDGNVTMAPKDLFAAPETRWGELSSFEAPSDIWSLGIICYQLLTRHHPYEDPDVRPKKFENKAWREDHFRNHRFLENTSAPARDFLKQMLTYKDFERPSAAEAFKHEWLKMAGKVDGRAKKDAALDRLDNFSNFDAQNKLEQAARLYMATNLLQVKERDFLDNIFRHLNLDKGAGLSKQDLQKAFEKAHGKEQSLKIEKMLENTFDRLDVEKKGVIDYNQFIAAAADDSMLLTKKNLRKTFDAIDTGKTGRLSAAELKAFCNERQQKRVMSSIDARRVIRQVDTDDCGQISFEDFCDLMLRKNSVS